ncbi:hypothetical protein U1Q18_007552 [Sarracenia purpurea var. burkii]
MLFFSFPSATTQLPLSSLTQSHVSFTQLHVSSTQLAVSNQSPTVSSQSPNVQIQFPNVSQQSPSSRSPLAISLDFPILPRQPITPPPHVIFHQPDARPLPLNTHSMVTRSKASTHTCFAASVSSTEPTSSPT